MSSPDLDLESRLTALRELLRGLFDGDQLRRFLFTLPGGGQLSDELPGGNASFAVLFHEASLLLHRWRLVDGELFNALVRARPTARTEIERVAALWSVGVTNSVRARGAPSLVGADSHSERAVAELRELRNKLAVLKGRGLPTAALEQAIREKARALQAGRSIDVGDTLAEGRYLIVEKLGAGGFSTVWRAWDDAKQREVAIKALKGELAGERSRVERFGRGARLMAGLVHPHIVRVYEEARVEGGLHYVVMELLSGGDLHARVLAGTLGRDRALDAVLGVGEALALAHAKGVVHRDVKPHNILLDEGGSAKLTDFDLGRAEDGTRDTGTAASMGTLMYAAPESLGNARQVGPEGDVASLAMTAAFCLHGADLPPDSLYRRDRFFATLDCSEAVRAVLVRASEHDPKDRYPSAGAFCEALKAALGAPEAPAPLVASPQAPIETPLAPRVKPAAWTPPAAEVPASPIAPPIMAIPGPAASSTAAPPEAPSAPGPRAAAWKTAATVATESPVAPLPVAPPIPAAMAPPVSDSVLVEGPVQGVDRAPPPPVVPRPVLSHSAAPPAPSRPSGPAPAMASPEMAPPVSDSVLIDGPATSRAPALPSPELERAAAPPPDPRPPSGQALSSAAASVGSAPASVASEPGDPHPVQAAAVQSPPAAPVLAASVPMDPPPAASASLAWDPLESVPVAQGRRNRWMLAGGGVGGVILVAMLAWIVSNSTTSTVDDASNLDCDKIMNMVRVNVPTSIIVSEMQSSGWSPSEVDVQCLVNSGAQPDVVSVARTLLSRRTDTTSKDEPVTTSEAVEAPRLEAESVTPTPAPAPEPNSMPASATVPASTPAPSPKRAAEPESTVSRTTTATHSSGLSCEEIMNMLNVGVPADNIVSTMKNGNTVLSESGIQCLVNAGAPPEVVSEARAARAQWLQSTTTNVSPK